MSTPIYSDLSIDVTITKDDADAIIAEGFPVYGFSVNRFNHTQVPYKNIYQAYQTIAAYNGQTVDTSVPAWFKEVLAVVDTADTTPQPVLVRETYNSRSFYINVTVTA